jgi:hypothetical protein
MNQALYAHMNNKRKMKKEKRKKKKSGMSLPIGEYPGLLIELVRVGFCEAPALGIEQDQRDQPTHPWLLLKTLHVPRVTKASASMGYLGATTRSTL